MLTGFSGCVLHSVVEIVFFCNITFWLCFLFPTGFMKEVLRLLQTMRVTLQLHSDQLAAIAARTRERAEVEHVEEVFCGPCSNLDEFLKLEENFAESQEKRAALVRANLLFSNGIGNVL